MLDTTFEPYRQRVVWVVEMVHPRQKVLCSFATMAGAQTYTKEFLTHEAWLQGLSNPDAWTQSDIKEEMVGPVVSYAGVIMPDYINFSLYSRPDAALVSCQIRIHPIGFFEE